MLSAVRQFLRTKPAGTAVIGGRTVLVFSCDDPVHPQDSRATFEKFASTVDLVTGIGVPTTNRG
jgi:hypothetical protein